MRHFYIKQTSGLTLVELIIASTILVIVFTMIVSTYVNFTSTRRKMLLTNELHAESMFLLERIAREIQNGSLDYQGYWRENLKNRTASNWIDQTDINNDIYEGVNFFGVDSDGTSLSSWGLNHIKNCNDPNSLSSADNVNDTDDTEEQMDILYNYRYQFIFPGNTNATGNDHTDSGGTEFIHLNCTSDNYNEADGYNVYDDEPAYGSGPRAFDEDSSGSIVGTNDYDATRNYANSANILWDWDLTDNSGTPDPVTSNNPPLLLIKELETPDDDGFTHVRTALRFDDNKIKLIRFRGDDTDTDPPDFIPDQWMCEKEFGCGNTTLNFDGSYVWSQKEMDKLASPTADEINSGFDNGIGTITDSDLEWEDITPEKIEVLSFDFILSPVKDPYRAFFEDDKVQKMQVSVIIETQVKQSAMTGARGTRPSITLQTMVTPRIWNIVEADN